jgi:hypothetical protein
MIPRVCKCCGEPMPENGRAHTRNPNLCGACAGIVDEPVDVAADPPQDSVPMAQFPDEAPQPMRKAA